MAGYRWTQVRGDFDRQMIGTRARDKCMGCATGLELWIAELDAGN